MSKRDRFDALQVVNEGMKKYVQQKIAEAQISGGGGGGNIDLTDSYVSKVIGNADQITFSDGQTFQNKLDNGTLKGPKGDIGERGLTGEKGDKGDQGEIGPAGADGKDAVNPNFNISVSMLAAGSTPTATITGTYPNLVINLGIPYSGASGGGIEETSNEKMWYGSIPYDETGVAGFNSEDQIGIGITPQIINFGINAGTLIETTPQTLNKAAVQVVTAGDYVCVIVPASSSYVPTIDNGFGEKVSFGSYPGGSYNINGETITNQIDGISYKIYGLCMNVANKYYIYVD